MSDPITEPKTERLSEKLKSQVAALEAQFAYLDGFNKGLEMRIKNLENAVSALLDGMIKAEKQTGEVFMDEGEFYGRKFTD